MSKSIQYIIFYAVIASALVPGILGLKVLAPEPADGALVPADISAISYAIDGTGSISYTVTTSPDIGSASGSGVSAGRISIPVSGVQSGQTYAVTIRLQNGTATEERQFMFTTYTPSEWGLDEWSYRRIITVDHAQVIGDLTDFPVLIDISDSSLAAHAKSDGSDIIFMQDGVQLAHEIEGFSSGRLIAWVKARHVSAVQDAQIQMFYGNPSYSSNVKPESAWDELYMGVYHADSSGSFADSTGRDNDGAVLGGANLVSGLVDGGYNFDGINDRIQLPQLMTTEKQFTFEAWVKSANKHGYIISQRDTSSRGAFTQFYPPSSEYQMYSNTAFDRQSGSYGQWTYIAGVFDGTELRTYVNAVSTVPQPATITWPSIPMIIGDRSISGRQFLGQMDEIRISKTGRSDGYIRTSFNNQRSPSQFITLGNEQTQNNMPVISNVIPADGAGNVQLNPTLSGSISDSEADTFQYRIELQEEGSWALLESGSGDGIATFSVAPTTAIEYDTLYSWRIVIESSGETREYTYSFTTLRESNNLPVVLFTSPANNSADVGLRPELTAEIEDPDGDTVSWSIAVAEGNLGFTTIGSGSLAGAGMISAQANAVTKTQTRYQWRIALSDSYGQAIGLYNFTTMYANPPAEVQNELPMNASQDVMLNPTLQAEVSDPEGEQVSWQIQIYRNSAWQTLASGTEADGQATISVGTSTVTSYNTAYRWRVIAQDIGSGQQTLREFTFRTRLEHYAPSIINTTPSADAQAVSLNASLVACVEDKDGDLMDITISLYSGSWRTLAVYNNSLSGCFVANSAGYVSSPITDYTWRVKAVDPTGRSVEQTLDFTTGGTAKLKYTTSFYNQKFIQIHPLMGDVDKDGVNEIVFNADRYIYIVDGRDGRIERRLPDSMQRAPELVDLNNDGTPEILYVARNSTGWHSPQLRAYFGNGNLMWATKDVGGDDTTMFPVVAFDIDGTGYPRIYFATEDTDPDPYSGNPADYRGAVYMVDHKGNVLASQPLSHPCWGGLSLGDADFDGRFELYVSDRMAGYHNFTTNKGLHAYDAHTLDLLWSKPTIQHSSPMGVLADVIGDERLEMVATEITVKGPLILDAITGVVHANYSSARVPTHATPTVYDFDGDGNLEAMYSTSYPAGTTARNITVFDLVTGKLDFSTSLASRVAWPPRAGDVTGDGVMEMLVGVGEQDDNLGTYPVIIYDSHYNMIDRFDVPGAGQLSAPRLFDVDKDGLQELVVAGVAGKLAVYDTRAPVPNPAPRTWVQAYSEYRQGAAEYVEAPGPKNPKISGMTPADGSVDVALGQALSARVHDFQQDRMTVTVEIDDGSGWLNAASFANMANGNMTVQTAAIVTKPGTAYSWRITADDGKGHQSVQTQSFTTAGASPVNDFPAWHYKRQLTINRSQVSGTLSGFTVLVDMNDAGLAAHAKPDGSDIMFAQGTTVLPHEVESYQDGRLVAWVRVPQVSSASDTHLTMYYGNSAYTAPSGEAAWAGYNAVYHMGDFADSTANNRDGTPSGGPVAVQGLIGPATRADGVDDRVTLPQVYSSEGQYTMEAWVNTGSRHGYIISQRSTVSTGSFLQYYPLSGEFQMYSDSAFARMGSSAGEWHYVVGTFDGSTIRLYVDAGAPASVASTITWPGQSTYLFDRATSGRQFLGQVDEVRLSPVTRSPDYIKTTYNNAVNKMAFLSVGPEAMQ